MATNDTAALVVALSAQLTRFEKDMQGAVAIADKRAKEIENVFARTQAAIGKQFDGISAKFSSQLGGIGSVIGALGPIGTTAAIGLGAIVLALSTAANMAHELAQKAQELKRFSEATGLTTDQVQALRSEASKFGLTSEEAQTAIQNFTARFQELRLGSGELLKEIQKINPALAEQMQRARTAGDALTLLGSALARTNDVFERNALVKAASGRGGIAAGSFLTGLNVDEVTRGFVAGGKAIDENLIKKLADLEIQIEKTSARSRQNIALIFSEGILNQQLKFVRELEELSRIAKDFSISSALQKLLDGAKEGKLTGILSIGALGPGIGSIVAAANALRDAPQSNANRRAADTNDASRSVIAGQQGLASADAQLRNSLAETTPEAQLAKMKQLIEVLGAAATPTEQLAVRMKQLGIAAHDAQVSTDVLARAQNFLKAEFAVEQLRNMVSALSGAAKPTEVLNLQIAELGLKLARGAITFETYTRAINEAKRISDQSIVAARERIGVVSQEEIVITKIRELEADRAKGFIRSAEEAVAAEQIIRKESRETFEQLKIRASAFPGLTRLGLDAANLNKQFDDFAVSGLNNLTTGLSDIVTGTAKAGDAFKNLGLQVVRSLSDMVIKMTIVAPIARALQASLGSFLPGTSAAVGTVGAAGPGFVVPTFAGGGMLGAGRFGIAGENGPELIRGPATIVPADITRQLGSGTSNVLTFAPVINAPGASREDMVSALAIAQRDFEAKILPTVRDAVRRRAL